MFEEIQGQIVVGFRPDKVWRNNISGRKLSWNYEETNRIGDHIWWISDVRKFQKHYPSWKFRYSLREILEEIHRAVSERAK